MVILKRLLLVNKGPYENPYVKWISSINGAEKNILMIKPRTWGTYPSKLTAIILSGHPHKNAHPQLPSATCAQPPDA